MPTYNTESNSISFWHLFFLSIILICSACHQAAPIDYNTQIKPIINAKCIACHGGVKQQGGFSLLFEDEALAELPSGKYGIVPGKPQKSEMIRRLSLESEDLRMPFEEDPLSAEEVELLTEWVRQGAKWGMHWAFEKVKAPAFTDFDSDRRIHPVDHFIQEQMKEVELTPSDPAASEHLVRRLALDLIGLPIVDSITQVYLSEPSDRHFEQLVTHLLDAPQYGEKWTTMWLDLARYADTKGYERDGSRDIWRYRDWVIRAFNSDMPYDQFITEQIAGDLLSNPSEDQLIATAFHRNTMTNDEGGTDNEEYRTAAVLDRVNTTWEALMGTTFSCVQCHSHPYDPFKHEDYYKFAAFFNNTRDEDTYADYPVLRHYNPIQKSTLDEVIAWVQSEGTNSQADEVTLFLKTLSPAQNSLTTDQFVNAELSDTKWLGMRHASSARLRNVSFTDQDELLFRYVQYERGGTCTLTIDGPKGKVIGTIPFSNPQKGSGWQISKIDIQQIEGDHDVYFNYENPFLTDPERKGIMFDWFHFSKSLPGKEAANFEKIDKMFMSLLTADVETTPILIENPKSLKRATRVFDRGNRLTLGELVSPGVPDIFHGLEYQDSPTRRDLAKWITSVENPLTTRTIVNRVWEQIFGIGLVSTLEDMGSQGASPSHRELLDYLSWTLVNQHDWSIKSLIKEIVMSDTYRQSSEITDIHLQIDPMNIYLARMPRIRLSAEQIRDQALYATGQLNEDMYGAPVMPYQPEGIWDAPYDGAKWKISEQEDQYRRAIYTYWKRTSPYPSTITFDGVGRELCTSRRIRTNTPLQALVILNDSVYIDLSRKLAQSVLSQDVQLSISDAYRTMTQRQISPARLDALSDLYQDVLSDYQKHPDAAYALCKNVRTDRPLEFAAMTIVANTILNLDEVVTKS